MSKDTPSNISNSAARLLAVQAVYQMMGNGQDAKSVIPEYLAHRAGMDVDGDKMVAPNEVLFSELVKGVEENQAHLEGLISANRTRKEGSIDKPEPLLLSVLMCGGYELFGKQSTDFPIIISDYVDIAKAFFDGKEPGLVNGILDSIRKVTRA
jgi:N utilization substance protein B